MGNNFPKPEEVAVAGSRNKSTTPKNSMSISFSEENIQVLREKETKRHEVETTYSPTNYISSEEDKSSFVEIDSRSAKATNKSFGVVKPGRGLTIISPGVMELKIGKGLKLEPDTGKVMADVESFIPSPGDNVLFTKLPNNDGIVINVKGEDELSPTSNRVPTSRAISSYTRKITGNISNLTEDLKEPEDTTLVDVLNTLHKRDHYTHSQLNPTAEWVIDHPLKKKPSVTITDETGEEMIGDVIYPSLHQVIIRFSAGFSGSALLN